MFAMSNLPAYEELLAKLHTPAWNKAEASPGITNRTVCSTKEQSWSITKILYSSRLQSLTQRQRQTETDRDRQRQTKTDRCRQKQTETSRDKQRQPETDRNKQRQIEAVSPVVLYLIWSSLSSISLRFISLRAYLTGQQPHAATIMQQKQPERSKLGTKATTRSNTHVPPQWFQSISP